MRVIAGRFRGKKLSGFKGVDIRPTSDRVKENVFNILSAEIRGGEFLDLFSGSGAIGIEALSRGAAQVYFCDAAKESAELTVKNLKSVGIDESTVLRCDFKDALNKFTAMNKKFDIIYIDPPYASDCYVKALELIERGKLLNDGGVAVCEGSKRVDYSGKLIIFDERKYGLTYISLFINSKEEQPL